MRKRLFPLILIFLFIVSVSAQKKEARKIDELINYHCDDMLARLDRLASETMEESNTKGFIIIYEGNYSRYINNSKGENELKTFPPKFGESAFRIQSMQKHLINFRNLPKQKFLFISGGFRENHTVELWIVPNGANPLKPTPNLENIKYRKGKPEDICAGLG